ncbi:AAA family ATPase [Nocardia sp. alder85J]|uniref:AAA family ATPase n=1 Tax=Nocardia sp. alder85J TaxID=2862949 RepID=UPI001CD4F599|nr:AAA family ATPase [Nocardia sp. alder85J]MCX4094846.1 AAA family ATPase [Nocardia sp. alder85J]
MQVGTPLTGSVLETLDEIGSSTTTGVIVVCGFPASGKSTAAAYLANMLDAVVLDKDGFAPKLEQSVMGELAGNPYDRDSATYRKIVGPYIYEALVRNALMFGRRQPVILDAPFIEYVKHASKQSISLSEYIRGMSDDPVNVKTVWISSSSEEIRSRMISRRAERDAPKLADWEGYRSTVLDSGVSGDAKLVADVFVYN